MLTIMSPAAVVVEVVMDIDPNLPREKAAVMPVLERQLTELAQSPPGPAANVKATAILSFIQEILKSPEISPLIPNNWKGYVTAALAVIGLLTSGGFLGRFTGTPTGPAEKPPIVIVVPSGSGGAAGGEGGISPIVPPTTKPAASKRKVVFYFTTADEGLSSLDRKTLESASMPYELAKAEQPGSGYRDRNKVVIALPVAVLLDEAGKELDAAAYPVKDILSFSRWK